MIIGVSSLNAQQRKDNMWSKIDRPTKPTDDQSSWSTGRRVYTHLASLLLFFCTVTFLGGCSEMVLLDPKGPVGETERFVIITAFVLMLIVVIPVIIMAFWFPWKYRADKNAEYTPKWSYSLKIELVVWLVPAAIVTCLGILVWHTTYRLDPAKAIDSAAEPLTIEAVSLDWKWLFIYPEQNIAVVNELVFPANVPLSFRITSDTVMTSFFIPQLGSQIYAMAGMQSRLHLLATVPGTYAGQNQQFSGRGYADMNFKATAVSPEQFTAWVDKARKSKDILTWERYHDLEEPTAAFPVTHFSKVTPELFEIIMHKYSNVQSENTGSRPMKAMDAKGE